MRPQSSRPPTPRLGRAALLAAPLLGACVHSDDHGPKVAHLAESEPNDAACCADYFGFLAPGELLSIQGAVTDDGFDPYDGFAFTAFEPITVEFRLYAHSGLADLDVCLYDPQLGITVDCFESPYDPEVGYAHVLSGNTDFHLVVNSFAGDSAYTLEVDVFPLQLDGAAPPPADAAGALLGAGHGPDEKPDRSADFAAYHGEEALSAVERRDPALVGLGEAYLVDERTGELSSALLAVTAEGTLVWMGNPEAAAEGEGR